MAHFNIMCPWKNVRNFKTTVCLGLHARYEAFTISSTSTAAVMRFLEETKKVSQLSIKERLNIC
jgi:hypothetical protein